MAKFVSIGGEWSPRQESFSMTNTFGRTLSSNLIVGPDGSHEVKEGDLFIYTGPDREAVKMLKAENLDFFGRNFKTDPEFLQATRNMGFNSPADYLKQIGFDEEEEIKKQKKNAKKIVKGGIKKTADEVNYLAGGKDSTGNKENNFVGGFGAEKLRNAKEVKNVKSI